MYLLQKLKAFERNIVFMRWGTSADYGKIKYVGQDFIEFEVIDGETLEYTETVLVNPNMILEIVLGGPDVSRVIAAVSSMLPAFGEDRFN